MSTDRAIRTVMTSDVFMLRPADTVEYAVASLAERGISGAPVADDDGRLVGLLDDTDLLLAQARLHGPTTIEILGAYLPLPGERHRFHDELRAALGQTVGEVMETDVRTVGPDDSVADAATAIVDGGVSRVCVVDEQRRILGIVTRGDLVAAMSRPAQT